MLTNTFTRNLNLSLQYFCISFSHCDVNLLGTIIKLLYSKPVVSNGSINAFSGLSSNSGNNSDILDL